MTQTDPEVQPKHVRHFQVEIPNFGPKYIGKFKGAFLYTCLSGLLADKILQMRSYTTRKLSLSVIILADKGIVKAKKINSRSIKRIIGLRQGITAEQGSKQQ